MNQQKKSVRDNFPMDSLRYEVPLTQKTDASDWLQENFMEFFSVASN